MQWTVLNSSIALTGYWMAAALVDKPWYGRRFMQVCLQGAGQEDKQTEGGKEVVICREGA